MTEGLIWKQLLSFFFPLLLGTFFQQMYNVADAVIVGRAAGKIALSAVGGSSAILLTLFLNFFIGVSSGASVIISQYFGANKQKDLSLAVHTALVFAGISGLVILLIGEIGSPWMLSLMGTPADTLPDSVIYMRIFFIGMPANLIYNMGSAVLRSVGDSKRPLYYLIFACVSNVILDLIFVSLLRMGVSGAALATVICQFLSAALVCMELIRTKECYRVSPSELRIDRKILSEIVRIGLPTGMQSLTYNIANVLIQSTVNSFGTDSVAAWAAYGKIDLIFWMVMNAFGISIMTFVGQNYGAGKMDRIRKGVRQCLMLTTAATLLIIVLIYSGSNLFLGFFTQDDAVISIGTTLMHFLVPTYITYVMVEVFSGALRGMGNTLVPTLITTFGVCVIRIIWILTLVPVYHNLITLITCYPVSWIICSICFLLYYGHDIKRRMRRLSVAK